MEIIENNVSIKVLKKKAKARNNSCSLRKQYCVKNFFFEIKMRNNSAGTEKFSRVTRVKLVGPDEMKFLGFLNFGNSDNPNPSLHY